MNCRSSVEVVQPLDLYRAARPEPYATIVSAPQSCLGFGSTMSTAVHDLLKDAQLHNSDPGIEGNFPLDAAVIESEAPSTPAAPKAKY